MSRAAQINAEVNRLLIVIQEKDKRIAELEYERDTYSHNLDKMLAENEQLCEQTERQARMILRLEKNAKRYQKLKEKFFVKHYREDGWEGAMWDACGLHDPMERGLDATIDATMEGE